MGKGVIVMEGKSEVFNYTYSASQQAGPERDENWHNRVHHCRGYKHFGLWCRHVLYDGVGGVNVSRHRDWRSGNYWNYFCLSALYSCYKKTAGKGGAGNHKVIG